MNDFPVPNQVSKGSGDRSSILSSLTRRALDQADLFSQTS
jgi:hypothetical protein